jgi:methionyl-tRNA formyltransferase
LLEFEKRYPDLISRTIGLFQNGSSLESRPQEDRHATYFGKRTPYDGEINWDWQKERIHNWVRAQASPYPGAFTFYEGRKLTIDAVEFTNTGYSWEMKNGSIVVGGKFPEVKTSNGVIKVIKHRSEEIFETGIILQ